MKDSLDYIKFWWKNLFSIFQIHFATFGFLSKFHFSIVFSSGVQTFKVRGVFKSLSNFWDGALKENSRLKGESASESDLTRKQPVLTLTDILGLDWTVNLK